LTAVLEEPTLPPIISYEVTDYGWRGLTEEGCVFEVRSANGHKPTVPETILEKHRGETLGRREVTNRYPFVISKYVEHYDKAVVRFQQNQYEEALAGFEAALDCAPTAAAKFNRGLVMLSLGYWPEGFAPYEARLDLMTPPMCRNIDLPRWRGEPIAGKRLLLVHDAGYGDTIMMLRYVPVLLERGADVHLLVPPELARLASQVAPVYANSIRAIEADFFCPMLSLLHLLGQTIESIPNGPYLHVDRALVAKWQHQLDNDKKKIGVAWSVGRTVEGDYPRAAPLAQMVAAVPGAEVHSVQTQGVDEAAKLGVITHSFKDFADCAAFMHCMDEIVTVDTAAAHVAGAIGHPDVTLWLSYWASWRWYNNPFYPDFKLLRQMHPDDWSIMLADR